MKIILKYKKTFIAVVMVSLLLAILPAISMWGFMSITFSEHDMMVETFNGYLNDYDYQSSLPEDYVYQAVNLKMDSTANLEHPSWNGNQVQFTKEETFSKIKSKQLMIQEWYLKEGTTLKWRATGNVEEGYAEYCLLSENGVEEYLAIGAEGEFKIEKSGNYGVLLNANFFKGSATIHLDLMK